MPVIGGILQHVSYVHLASADQGLTTRVCTCVRACVRVTRCSKKRKWKTVFPCQNLVGVSFPLRSEIHEAAVLHSNTVQQGLGYILLSDWTLRAGYFVGGNMRYIRIEAKVAMPCHVFF